MLQALASVAPGTPLRDGLDRILQAQKGALIVVGDGPDILQICSGGFLLDAEFTPQRVSELAKMDGAIILAPDASRIARANVHLVPDPSLATSETGTRHRTAERVARSVDVPVVSVSEDMGIITLYFHDEKHPLEPIPKLLSRANQALQTLERYKTRLDDVAAALHALEVEDLVTIRDVVHVLQRTEMVRRIAEEIDGYIVELGTDGRLLLLQLEELLGGLQDERRSIIRDYAALDRGFSAEATVSMLSSLSADALLDAKQIVRALRLPGDSLDQPVQARGHRILGRIPRLPDSVAVRIVERFGTLSKLMNATVEELCQVDGVGEGRAMAIKEGLERQAESSILERRY